MDSNGHSCCSLVKIMRLSQVRCFSTWINYTSNWTKTNFKKMDPWQPFRHDNNKFQMFIDSQFTLDYDSQMTDKYFAEYTRIEYDRRVNKRQTQTHESKVDTRKTLDADLVVTKSNGTESEVQDESIMTGMYRSRDADIRPIYDEEPMDEEQITAKCDIFAIRQQHTEQPEIINEGRVDQYLEQRQVKSLMLDSSPDNQTTDYSKQSLESENILLQMTVPYFKMNFFKMEAHCNALELKYQIML
ncbi:hypothetical protein Tco_1015422 [Tanacetum coccineum]|uniref:Uncharacterized protein n=1 Tax=Tanacetum coccineum TaxID=301880 RepID=A0ABQ5FML6_9ASTR